MSKATNRAAGTCRARCARRLGLDGNPLRRPADRAEAWLRLTVLILILAVVPVAAVIASRTADHLFTRVGQAQQSADHQVSAVITQSPPATAIDPYVAVPDSWVPARWTAPDGTARSGEVLAPIGSYSGSVVHIWVNVSGTVVNPPAGHQDVVSEVAVTVTVTIVALIAALLGVLGAARHFLDRLRFRAWDAEWRSTGPLWTGHRS